MCDTFAWQRSEGHGAGLIIHGEAFLLQVPEKAAEVCRLCPGVHRSSRWVRDILITGTLSTNRRFTLLQNCSMKVIFAVHSEAMATSGKTDKSPHDQEIKFFAKVWKEGLANKLLKYLSLLDFAEFFQSHGCVFFPQVLLPLIDQTLKNHCLYFLSTPSKNLSSCGCASNKEKEMVTRYRVVTISDSFVGFLLLRRFFCHILMPPFYFCKKNTEFLFHISYFLFPCLLPALLCSLCSFLFKSVLTVFFFPAFSVSWQLLSDTGFLSLVRLALPCCVCSPVSLL